MKLLSIQLRVAGPGHAVADPAFIEDVGRVGRVVSELAPEALDDGPHELGVSMAPPTPDLAQQRIVTGIEAPRGYRRRC